MSVQIVRGKLAALLLGPVGVGVFNQLSLMWNMFQITGSLGAFNALVQNASTAVADRDEAALRRLVSTASILLAATSCLAAAVGVIFAAPLSDLLLDDGGAHKNLVALILLSIPFGVTSQVYRALLSASLAVRHLVRAQVVSDLLGAALFAALIFPLGLTGAILGFMATHFFFLVSTAVGARATLGPGYLRPRIARFRWAVVRRNFGFGATSLLMIFMSNLSVIVVSRFIIDSAGLAASGIFANAWRIGSVYLGSVTATAFSYSFPKLTQSPSDAAMVSEANRTIHFYLYLLPPLMAGIMMTGEVVVWLILSREFLAVAPLLLIFVPAELARIVAESIAMMFLARSRLVPHLALYAMQVFFFVGCSALLLPSFGLTGAAFAYAGSTTLAGLASYAAARRAFRFRFEPTTRAALLRAGALLVATAAACALFPLGLWRVSICAVCGLGWLAATLRDEAARNLVRRFIPRLGKAG